MGNSMELSSDECSTPRTSLSLSLMWATAPQIWQRRNVMQTLIAEIVKKPVAVFGNASGNVSDIAREATGTGAENRAQVGSEGGGGVTLCSVDVRLNTKALGLPITTEMA